MYFFLFFFFFLTKPLYLSTHDTSLSRRRPENMILLILYKLLIHRELVSGSLLMSKMTSFALGIQIPSTCSNFYSFKATV